MKTEGEEYEDIDVKYEAYISHDLFPSKLLGEVKEKGCLCTVASPSNYPRTLTIL